MLDPLCAVPMMGAAYHAGQALGEFCPFPDGFFSESAADEVAGDDRNPAQDKKLSAGEIRALKEAGIDPEDLKGAKRTGSTDLYKDKKGNVQVEPKGGGGRGEPTGYNTKDFM